MNELVDHLLASSSGTGVRLVHLDVTRGNIDRVRADMMSGHTDDNKVQCNFDALELYTQKCDTRCQLWAAEVNGRFRGFMLIRRGLKADIRWNPTPGSQAAFTGFIPHVEGFDHQHVIDILMLCSHGGPKGVGQLLVLLALAMSPHGTFLQLSTRMEEHRVSYNDLTIQERFGPAMPREGDKYLVIRHQVLDVAKHIYEKFGFRQIAVQDNLSNFVGGVYYYRAERMNQTELDEHIRHLEKYGVVVGVRLPQPSAPEHVSSDMLWDFSEAPVVQPLGGLIHPPAASAAAAESGDPLEFGNFQFDPYAAGGAASPPLPVYSLGGFMGGDDDELAFPGAGLPMVDGNVVGSEQPLLQVEGPGAAGLGPPVLQPPRPRVPQRPPAAKKPKKKQPVAKKPRSRYEDSSSSEDESESSSSSSEDEKEEKKERRHRPRKTTTCDICGHKFANRQNLNRHVKIHYRAGGAAAAAAAAPPRGRHREAPVKVASRLSKSVKKYECNVCGKTFPGRSDNLKRHIAEVHNPQEKEDRRMERRAERCGEDEDCEYKCLQCGKTFTNQQNLIRHKKSKHSEEAVSRRHRHHSKGRSSAMRRASSRG